MNDVSKVFLSKEAEFGNEVGSICMGEFYPGKETIDYVDNEAKVLVIGAGGLGCEILKCLAYSGFKHIDIIDMDTIDLSNLNRQFLFREKDVGRMKSEVAKEFLLKRRPDLAINSHTCPIQEKSVEFYRQFSLVIAGLDNIKARRWINALLHELVETDEEGQINPETVVPLIDGGTEGLKGQTRVIIPYVTACFECSLDMFQQNDKLNSYPLCTLADKPRKPEHCIMFAFLSAKDALERGKEIRKRFLSKFGEVSVDGDNYDHVNFIFLEALERSKNYRIEGVTYSMTLGVMKNIIPAIASTNCLIASNCVNEALKLATFMAPTLDNYFLFNGTVGAYSHSFKLDKLEHCPVCDPHEITIQVNKSITLEEFINKYLIEGNETNLKLEKPSLTTTEKLLFMQNPQALRDKTTPNLKKPLTELMQSGDFITVTDPLYPGDKRLDIQVHFN